MQSILKKKIGKILETDYDSAEIDDCFLILDENYVEKKELTVNEVEDQAQEFFLNNINNFIEMISPVYHDLKGVMKAIGNMMLSLNYIEDYVNDLKMKNQLMTNKLKKFKNSEELIDEKIQIFEELVKNLTIDKKKMNQILNDTPDIGNDFFESFERLNKISELEAILKEINMDKSTLYVSLEKDINEIKSIGITKLVKYIGKNFDKITKEFVIQSIKLLKSDAEIYQNFKLKLINLRPDIPLEIIEEKYQMEYTIEDEERKSPQQAINNNNNNTA